MKSEGMWLSSGRGGRFWEDIVPGEATVIMTCPCAMPSQEAAFFVTEIDMARYPDQGHNTEE